MLILFLGCNIDVWTFDELRLIVKEFKEVHDSQDEELSCKFRHLFSFVPRK
jgi:hypothetical protein